VLGIEARLAFDLRATWQARILVACAQEKREGVIGAVALSVLRTITTTPCCAAQDAVSRF
jgi:hypothetical protein